MKPYLSYLMVRVAALRQIPLLAVIGALALPAATNAQSPGLEKAIDRLIATIDKGQKANDHNFQDLFKRVEALERQSNSGSYVPPTPPFPAVRPAEDRPAKPDAPCLPGVTPQQALVFE